MSNRYKSRSALQAMTAQQLIKYKKYLLATNKDILQSIADWRYAHKMFLDELEYKLTELQVMAIEAKIDREDAETWEFDYINGVH